MAASVPPELVWVKSSRSVNGNCVEVARSGGDVYLRDSKDPDGATLRFSADRWRDFLHGVFIEEFDLQ